LWDGFDAINARSDQGIQVVKDIAEFLKKRAQLEAEYAKNLAALCKAAPGSAGGGLFGKSGPAAIEKETKTLKAALLSIQEEGSRAATGHQEFANKVLNDVVKPLETFLKNKEADKKKFTTDGQKRVKALQEAKAAVDKAKDVYLKTSKEAETATEAHDKAKKDLEGTPDNKKHQEAEKRAAQKAAPLNEKAKSLETAYQKSVETANDLIVKTYGEYLPPLIDSFQALEEERYSQLRTVLQEYVAAQRLVPENLQERVQDIDKNVTAIDVEGDLTEFVDAHRSPTTEPAKLVFTPYKEPAGSSSSSSATTTTTTAPTPAVAEVQQEKAPEPQQVESAPVEEQKTTKSEDDIF
jgi:hypothetical protein